MCRRVAKIFTGTVTLLCVIGKVNFIFENRVVANMTDSDSIYCHTRVCTGLSAEPGEKPVYIITSYIFNIHFNIILPSVHTFSKYLPLSGFLIKLLLAFPLSSLHVSLFDNSNNIWQRV
jgi:hypothetical protein